MLAVRCECTELQGWFNHPLVTLVVDQIQTWKKHNTSSHTTWACPRCGLNHEWGYLETLPRRYRFEKVS